MSNNINHPSSVEHKNYLSLSEFESFYKFPDGNPLMIVDTGCKIIFSNSSFRNIFNLSENEAFFNLSSEPDISYLLLAITGSNFNNFHFDLFFTQGQDIKDFNFNVEIERIYIEEKEYFVLIFNSLEEKARLEEKINNLHTALDHGNIPVLVTDSEGRISYATNSFEFLLKRDIEYIYNNPLPDILAPYLTIEEKRHLEDCIENFKTWTKTTSFLDMKKNVLYYEMKLNPIFRAGEDNLRFILTANDITNFVLKNQIIKKSERRLKSIINNISDLLFIFKEKDGELFFENSNDNFCKTFLIDKYKSIKKPVNSVIEEKLFGMLVNSIKEFDEANDGNIEFRYRDLKEREYSISISFIDDRVEDEKIYIVSMRDITDQILYQEQLKKAYAKEMNLNKLKTALLENMSHEIRTPFNALSGYAEIIDDCVMEKDYNTILDLVTAFKDVLSRVLHLFTNIVEVFQIEAGETELEIVELNCNQVLRSVYNKMSEFAERKKIDFHLELEENELNIKTDWSKLEMVINSLVDNALKYTDYGEVKIHSRLFNDKAEIRISDTGSGMDTTRIKQLLEPFVQEEEAYVRNYEGAGLGLTVANKLTTLLGGDFNVISSKNKGTTVILTFPSVDAMGADDY
ncbi:MAG: PAS domain-containing sensor histidine kinase [Ignavibacteriaceae bacterium]|nr:PAS domain-containing sensor histidine kinase [Ignavibacteriaceae bacterium]